MKILLLILLIGILVLMPSQANSEPTSYEMKLVGFSISDSIIAKISGDIDLSQNKLIMKKGKITIGIDSFSVQNFTINSMNNGKLVKVSVMTDDHSVNLTGRLISQTGLGEIYEMRGIITSDTYSDRVVLIASIKQKSVPDIVTQTTLNESKELISKPQIESDDSTKTPLKPKKELVVAFKHDERNYWNDNYDVYVKVFDKKINPNPKFDDFKGLIKNTIVITEIVDQNGKKYTLSGKSHYGEWHGTKYFPENVSFPGKYIVNITAVYENSEQSQLSEMFLFGTASNRITVINGTNSTSS